eukprot:COSAG01_NODE_13236_length_1615_cov_2.883905_3_plen_113_part_00
MITTEDEMNRNAGESQSPMPVLLTVAVGMAALTAEDGGGVLLFMLSAVLSRGVAGVRADMDHAAGAPLIGGHGYCMQVRGPRRPAPPPPAPAPPPRPLRHCSGAPRRSSSIC